MEEKAYNSLSTKVRNALHRNRAKSFPPLTGFHSPLVDTKPWELPIRDLLKIKGIGPAAIKEIAQVAEKLCV